MVVPAYLPPLHNGNPEDPIWWTGVLGERVPLPANLTRGLSIIINPLVRLPWLFDGGDPPPWVVDPMLFNGQKPGAPFSARVEFGEYAFAERESRFDFWARWIRDAILYGRGTFSYIAGADGPKTGTVVRHKSDALRPPAMEHATDTQKWTLTWNGTPYPVDSQGVLEGTPGPRRIHFMRGHEGGVLQSHIAELTAAAGISEYASTLFDGAVPSGVLTTDQAVNQDQANLTREEWERTQSRRRIAVLGNGTKYQQVTMSPVDAAIGQMLSMSNTQVAHMLELPASMLDGTSGDSMTYSNRTEDNKHFVDGPLASWASRVEESISALLPWGQFMTIDFTEYTKTLTQPAAQPAPPEPAPEPEPTPEEVTNVPDPA